MFPTLAEVKAIAAGGDYRRVPVCRELMADRFTTVEVSYIGEAKAKEIALAKVSGATAANITKCKLDYDDGRWEYDVEIRYNGLEYEFEIDAYTGTIISWDVDD